MQRSIYDLVSKEVKHKKYGMCQVTEIINANEFKIAIKVLEDQTIRKVLFSSGYFEDIDEYEHLVGQEFVRKEKRAYKKPDLSKYRRHPLVKEIDARELKLRVQKEEESEQEEEQENEE